MIEPEIVLGPPGTGKTETLLREVEELLGRGVEPEEIGFVTFTKRAAGEAITRASEKFGLPQDRFRWFRTLHSLCFRCVGLNRSDILTGKTLEEFAEWSGVAFSQRSASWEEGWSGAEMGDRIMHLENLSRVSGRTLEDVYNSTDHDLPWSEVRRVARDLDLFKVTRGLIDFTDMLREFVGGAVQNLGLKALFVDEAQDLSSLQWQVVGKLAEDNPGLGRFVIAGDDDQAIYEWAGAAVGHFIHLPGRSRVLGQSWRVPASAQRLASEIIGRVEDRREKRWSARPEEGFVDYAVNIEEVDVEGDVLILARNHIWLEKDVAPVLRREGIYFSLRGEPSMSPDTLAAVRGWTAWGRGEEIPAAVARTIQGWLPTEKCGRSPEKGEDMVSADLLGVRVEGNWFDAFTRMPPDDLSYILSARQRGESLSGVPKVRLSTIHGSKGGQADHVVLLTNMSKRSYEEAEKWPDQETRVWYVGVTRAREKLTVVSRPSAPKHFSM